MYTAHHGHKVEFSTLAGANHFVDFNPAEDIRSAIEIKFIDGPSKYPLTRGDYVVLKWGEVSPHLKNYTRAPHYLFSSEAFGVNHPNSTDKTINFYRVSESAQAQKIRVFPASEIENGLQIVVNELERKISVKPNETTKFEVVTVNINHYDSGIDGSFNISLITKDNNGNEKLLDIKPFRPSYGNLLNVFRPTEASIHLLPDASYFLDFYITDALGTKSLQDEIQLDL